MATVDELHIALDLELRGTNTFTFRRLEPEEKDWWLNRAQYDFIWSKTELANNIKGLPFAVTQKRLDDIQNLIIPKELPLYKVKDGEYFTFLPSDYLMLIADYTLNIDVCTEKQNVQTKDVKLYYTSVAIPSLSNYTDLQITLEKLNSLNEIEETVIFNPADYTSFLNTIVDTKQKFYLIYLLKELVRSNPDIELYWEDFNGVYKKGHLFIVSSTNYTSAKVTLNGNITSYGFVFKTYKQDEAKNNKYTQSHTVVLSPETLHELLDDWFYKPKGNKCILTIKNNKLFVYSALNVALKAISFEYYRIPRIINYVLEQTSEIVSTRHDDLAARAALKIANRNPNDNVQFLTSDFIQNKEN